MKNKDEFLRQMESQLYVWRTQLAQINIKSNNLEEGKRKEIEKDYNNLQLQIREFQNSMEAIGKTNGNSWQKLQVEAENLRNRVGKAISEIASAVSKTF